MLHVYYYGRRGCGIDPVFGLGSKISRYTFLQCSVPKKKKLSRVTTRRALTQFELNVAKEIAPRAKGRKMSIKFVTAPCATHG